MYTLDWVMEDRKKLAANGKKTFFYCFVLFDFAICQENKEL